MNENLEGLIVAMFECAVALPNEERVEMSSALVSTGATQPLCFLSAAHAFLMQHNKLHGCDRAFVLLSLNEVLQSGCVLQNIAEQQALLMINLATQEMTMSKDVEEEWPQAACDVVLTLGKKQWLVAHVMDALLHKFPPGLNTPPHTYVVHALHKIAQHNAVGFVPFLTDVLSRSVPILHLVRTEAQRYAWAQALTAFCEAVREYATTQHTAIVDYSDQMEALYDVVITWFNSKDYKVKAHTANCIGELCLMMSSQRVQQDMRRVIPMLLTLHRKASNEQCLITQGLCRFLEATCSQDNSPLEAYLEDILNSLFPLVCSTNEPLPSCNTAIRNQNEAFRCFHVAASRFADKLVYYLLHKMQHVQDASKLGAIHVLRHLLNSTEGCMDDKRALVLLGLRPLLQNDASMSIKVKKGMCQLCVALADHGYVDVEAGDCVIAFLVTNLVQDQIQMKRSNGLDSDNSSTPAQLRTQCGQALQTIANTCPSAHKLLWPYLFELVCVECYTCALTDIFKCIRILAQRTTLNGELDLERGFDNVKVAGSCQVLSRLVTCLGGAPFSAVLGARARESLRLLRALACWFPPRVSSVFNDDHIDIIMHELSPTSIDNTLMQSRSSRINKWHSTLLQVLKELVQGEDDKQWLCCLAAAMAKQLSLYTSYPDDKAFVLRCLGCVLSQVDKQQSLLIDHIILMYRGTNHASHAERVGVAQAVGYCAAIHTQLVLTQLENVAKWEFIKKTPGLFGFIKDAMPYKHYSDVEMINLRASIMLSYGYVVLYCPTHSVVPHLENTVLLFLRSYFDNPRQETVVREALLETIYLIALAVHRLNASIEYSLTSRDQLLAYIKEYIQGESTDMLSSSIPLLGSKAVAQLVQLEPVLSDDQVWDMGQVLTRFTLSLCRERSGLKTMDDDESSTMMQATVNHYHLAVQHMVQRNANINTVTLFLKLMQPYYCSLADHERSRSVDTTILVLSVYTEHAQDLALGHATDFTPMSSLLARLVPRTVDCVCSIRCAALHAVHYTFQLAFIHKGLSRDSKDTSLFDAQLFIKQHLAEDGKLDGDNARRAIELLADVLESRLPQCQLQTYLSGLFDMLNDRQSRVSCAAAQLLHSVLLHRGHVLSSEATIVIRSILEKLPQLHSSIQTYSDVLNALLAFAAHQLYPTCDVLLSQPLPFSISTTDVWHCIAGESSLFSAVLDYWLELMSVQCTSSEPPYQLIDNGTGTCYKVVHPSLCTLVCAFIELIKSGEPEQQLHKRVPQLMTVLIIALVSVVDTQYPVIHKDNDVLIITPELRRLSATPAVLVSQALRTLLLRTKHESVIDHMNTQRAWSDSIVEHQLSNAMWVLIRCMYEHRAEWVLEMVQLLESHMNAHNEACRYTATTVMAALVHSCTGDSTVLHSLLSCLIDRGDDVSLRIRKMALCGLSDVSLCNDDTLDIYSAQVVAAAMKGLDDTADRRDEIAIEAINTLCKLSPRVQSQLLNTILPDVLLKLTPCFEKDKSALRAVSFSLLGELGHRVGQCTAYKEHLLSNVVALLLHLNDEDQVVRQMCSECVIAVKSVLGADDINNDYLLFLKHMSSILSESFPDRIEGYVLRCTSYFNSTSSQMRSNAVHMTAYLLTAKPKPDPLSHDLVISGLLNLLKDQQVAVRISTAKAICTLCAHIDTS